MKTYFEMNEIEKKQFGYPDLPENEQIKIAFKSFLDWVRANKVVFEESEKLVYSKKYQYAGTLDFLAIVNGKRMVGDIKTSNAIYPESYYLQVAAYRYALQEENPTLKIDGELIIRIPKTNKSTFEIKTVEGYKDNANAFICAIFLYRQIIKLKTYYK